MEAGLHDPALAAYDSDAGVETCFQADAFEGDVDADTFFRMLFDMLGDIVLGGVEADCARHELLRQAISRRGFLTRSALGAGGLALGGSFLASCGGKEGARAGGTVGAGVGRGGPGKWGFVNLVRAGTQQP